MKRVWRSFSISFGVVPEAISAWNPDSAPQAMVTNRNGNSGPGRPGPLSRPANSLNGGHGDFRADHDDGHGQHHDDADLHEGGEVVARGQEEPDRQDGGDEAVDDDDPGEGDLVQVEERGTPFGRGDGSRRR